MSEKRASEKRCLAKKMGAIEVMSLVFLLLLALVLHPTVDLSAAEDNEHSADARGVSVDVDNHVPVVVPEPTELAIQRYRTGSWWWAVSRFWRLFIPLAFLLTGWSARLRTWAKRWGRSWFATIAIYVIGFAMFDYVLRWPLSFYLGFVREHAYGLSNQTFSKWIHDSLTGLVVTMVMGVLFIWAPYLVIKRSPRRWWLYIGSLVPPFLCLQILLIPVLIDPLFNKFEPMKDQRLEAKILNLAAQCGIEGGRVFEVNKSVDTKAVNAYVTGFLTTKRIVLWDTLLNRLDDDEILFVMGHEMGHYVLHHIAIGILLGSAGTFIGLYLVYRLSSALVRRYGERFGIETLDDIASLPLFLVLLGLFAFLTSPISLAISRHHEREADRFAVELTRLNRAAATGFVKLQEENLGVPWHGPLYKLWRDTHPPAGERITFFNQYRPWETNEPLVYQRQLDGVRSASSGDRVRHPGD